MGQFIDLTGRQFGRLTVLQKSCSTRNGVKWECRCACGKTTLVFGASLRKGLTKSCGCYHSDIVKKSAQKVGLANRKHGMSQDRIHNIWRGMKQRCMDPNFHGFREYGGRGITVCPEWAESFEAFRDWALANGYQDDLTIDRIDNDGPYSPDNCQWITNKVQQSNRRNNRLLTYDGRTQTLAQWAEETGIGWGTIAARIRSGWSVDRALTEPIHTANRRKEN